MGYINVEQEIDTYITNHYQRWRDYAAYYCKVCRVNLEPAEVLNNILCDLLSENSGKVSELIKRKGKNGLSEFDYLILSIIRTNIISPRSACRYVKGQRWTQRIGQLEYRLADDRQDDNEEYTERILLVQEAIDELQISEESRRIFLWRFEGRNFKDWPGPESLDYLYDVYNRIELLIRHKIWRKNR